MAQQLSSYVDAGSAPAAATPSGTDYNAPHSHRARLKLDDVATESDPVRTASLPSVACYGPAPRDGPRLTGYESTTHANTTLMGLLDNIKRTKPDAAGRTTRMGATPSAAAPSSTTAARTMSSATAPVPTAGTRGKSGRRRKGVPSPRDKVATAAAPLHDRRRRLVSARETTLRDLGGLMLEMYKRNRFREELLLDKCEEVLAIEVEIAHVDQRLFQLAPPSASGMRPIGRCECGAPIHPGQNFCGVCGRSFATLTQARSCATCGAGLRPGDQYCATCGHEAPDALQVLSPPAAASTFDSPADDARVLAASAVADTIVMDTPAVVPVPAAAAPAAAPLPATVIDVEPAAAPAAATAAQSTAPIPAVPTPAPAAELPAPDVAMDAALASVSAPAWPLDPAPVAATPAANEPAEMPPDAAGHVDLPAPPAFDPFDSAAVTPPQPTTPAQPQPSPVSMPDASPPGDTAAPAKRSLFGRARKSASSTAPAPPTTSPAGDTSSQPERPVAPAPSGRPVDPKVAAKLEAARRRQRDKEAKARAKAKAKAARAARKGGGA